MREYSRRERILFGVMGIVSLATGILVATILITLHEMRTLGTWAGAVGALGGFSVFMKIALTGTSWRFFELPVNDPFSEQDEKKNAPPRSPSDETRGS